MNTLRSSVLVLCACSSVWLGCTRDSAPVQPPQAPTEKPAAEAGPTAEEAKAFVDQANADLKRLWIKQSTAEWIKATYITDDTERNAAAANEEVMAYLSTAIQKAARFKDVKADPDTTRMLHLLRISSPLPAPSDAAKRSELAGIAAKLEGLYGKAKAKNGKPCTDADLAEDEAAGNKKGPRCRNLQELSRVLATSRDYDEQLTAWRDWHSISGEMRPMYEKFVGLSNEGAKEIGFANLGDLWKSGYDMPPADFEQETDRLWNQVKPLYDDLHCYVRARLAKKYGADKVPLDGPIPAHLLGNMWAQEWANLAPMMEPYAGQGSLDVGKALVAKKYTPVQMVQLGEKFFTSLGLDPLPESFFKRSQFTKPRDRDVVCHASAWDVTFDNDLRIKMCIEPTEEDLVTVHHELGHNYYFMYYYQLPVLYQAGANDGFHEAIGDALTLSITPQYLKDVGLLQSVPSSEKALINVQMKDALEKVAFLPFGLLIDRWRWDVFSGKTTAQNYNQAWWELRKKYQGVAPPVARTEADFDPGAKYHVPANVPYTRYFLARILQFQFHKALCEAAGHQGPLHTCSIYGNEAAGQKLKAMLQMGASKPWPDALEALTGQRTLDATPVLDYFQPLRTWLQEQNKDQSCGWK